jgi:hypothetical protein
LDSDDARSKSGAAGGANVRKGKGFKKEAAVVDKTDISVREGLVGDGYVHEIGIVFTLEGEEFQIGDSEGGIEVGEGLAEVDEPSSFEVREGSFRVFQNEKTDAGHVLKAGYVDARKLLWLSWGAEVSDEERKLGGCLGALEVVNAETAEEAGAKSEATGEFPFESELVQDYWDHGLLDVE